MAGHLELADLAQAAARDVQRLLINARRALRRARAKAAELPAAGVRDAAAGRRRGRLAGAVNDLSDLLEATERIVGQTRQRIAGTTPGRGDRGGQSARPAGPADRDGPAR